MPIDRRSVVVDGRRVSYLTAGGSAAARAILLIHGSAGRAGYWINQLCSLGDAFQVAAIDLPGHGKSDPIPQASVEAYAETLRKFLEALGMDPVLVVGHSPRRAAQAMDLTRQATELEAPTLILCGSRDRLTPPALSEHLRKLIPRSRLSLVEGAGHMVLLEAPERVNQEILGFAASLRGEARSFTVKWERRGRSLVRRLLDWTRACVLFLTS